MQLSSQQIRQKYLEYYEKQGHKIVPSASLIPENDPTTLFTGSGMQPMVPYLLGEKHPLGTRIVDSQKAFRAADIDDIGDNRHTTFFEMLGNWSLGDYFKKEQIGWAFDFYINEMGLDPKNVYISVYRGNEKFGIPRDDEAVKLWQELFVSKGIDAPAVDMAEEKGMQGGRIFYYNEKENWWSRAGVPEKMPVGEPGGPDSEMFWDFGPEHKLHETWLTTRKVSGKYKVQDEHCHPACDCGRFLEFANNVFMQYKKTETGFEELAHKNIDFGGGLERIAVARNNIPDVFLGDLFNGIRAKIEKLSGKRYGADEKETKAFRVIMDHLRVVTFLIGDGAVPSNKDQGYFTRRMLRRAIRFARDLGIQSGLSGEVAKVVIAEYGHHYTELVTQKDFILAEIESEEKQFLTTLEKGIKEFERLEYLLMNSEIQNLKTEFLNSLKFHLSNQSFTTDGLNMMYVLDLNTYKQYFSLWGIENTINLLKNILPTKNILEISKIIDTIEKGMSFQISGTQAFHLYDTFGFPIELTQELAEEKGLKIDMVGFQTAFQAHKDLSRAGSEQKFKGGLADSSEATTELHTATHLLLAGLRKVLGKHVFQKGSNITAERLRFDFSQDDKVTEEQLGQVEAFVNAAIATNFDVTMVEMPKQAALDMGVVGSFWEKYPDIVKVYTMAKRDEVFSVELCGGPHVVNSSGLGTFKIQKEEACSRGVRRIKAVLIK